MSFNLKFRNPPGTLIYTGKDQKDTTIKHIQYSSDDLRIFDELVEYSDKHVDYISIEGLKNTEKIRDICTSINVDPLTIEDILNPTQRNKFEVSTSYLFSVTKFAYLRNNEVYYNYISILLLKDLIITFSEKENIFLDDIVKRLKNSKLSISKLREDYLFYVIYDMIVDEELNLYYHLNSKLEDLEDNLMVLNKNYQKDLYLLRKNFNYLESQTKQLIQYANPKKLLTTNFITSNIKKYLEDLEDHIVTLNENAHISLESVDNLFNVYSNNLSNKTNEIMKTLTIFSAIFIPLSFVTGFFGMNFTNFAILKNQYGLIIFTLICLIIPILMLLYFKKKKWF